MDDLPDDLLYSHQLPWVDDWRRQSGGFVVHKSGFRIHVGVDELCPNFTCMEPEEASLAIFKAGALARGLSIGQIDERVCRLEYEASIWSSLNPA